MSTVDFSQLPTPNLITELDFETIFSERKEKFIALFDAADQDKWRTILKRESDPVTKLLQENAYLELLYRNKCNADARALLIAYATDSDLDHLAVTEYGIQRALISAEDLTVTPPLPAVYESDERLKERCILSFDAMNTAGSAAAYRYFALSADGRVADVSVISDEANPYLLDIVVTQSDSEFGTASPELINIVQAALDPDEVRPICDRPTVLSSTATNYEISAILYVAKDAEKSLLLEAALIRLNKYIETVKKIGQSIRISAIYAALHVDGISRVELVTPTTDIVIDKFHHGYCISKNVIIGGTE